MDLSTYLAEHGMSAAQFGRAMNVSHTTVMRWANRNILPDERRVAEIVAATGGKVTAAELRPDMAALFSGNAA